MKGFPILAALAALLLLPAVAQAQAPDTAAIAAQQAAMGRLSAMRGTWRGTAVTQIQGKEERVTHTERVGTFLDGTVTLVEGKAYADDGSVPFHAFAVISYDAATRTYWMTSHAQGRTGRFELKLSDTGYVWEIPAGPATIRYTATLSGKSWVEVGDYIAPGQPPRRFFTMELTRLGDTSWPEAGGVAPR